MSRPIHPGIGFVMTPEMVRRLREEQREYDGNPDQYERKQKDWSFNECVARGCLPTGEPLEAKFGTGWWSK